MATYLVPPNTQWCDANGEPLRHGKLHTFALDTTQRRSAYTDTSLTIERSNPVLLDENGQAEIYTEKALKIVVMDANDVIIKSMDFEGNISTTYDNISDTPTTLAGLGIDAVQWSQLYKTPFSSKDYGLEAINWSSVVNTPTTIAGYGITDDGYKDHIGKCVMLSIGSAGASYVTPNRYQEPTDTIIEDYFPISLNFKSGQFIDSYFDSSSDTEFSLDAGKYRIDVVAGITSEMIIRPNRADHSNRYSWKFSLVDSETGLGLSNRFLEFSNLQDTGFNPGDQNVGMGSSFDSVYLDLTEVTDMKLYINLWQTIHALNATNSHRFIIQNMQIMIQKIG